MPFFRFPPKLGTPQPLAPTSSPTFASLTLTTPLPVASGGTAKSSLPNFSAYKVTTTDAQTVTSGASWTQVTFTGERWDVGSGFASSSWTPGVAGKVRVNTSIRYAASGGGTGTVSAFFRKNGTYDATSRMIGEHNNVPDTEAISLTGTAVFEVDADDIITVWISTQFNSIVLTDQEYTTFFQGEMLPNP